MDLHRFEAVTFDCYGTLVDWEAGILEALRPLRQRSLQQLGDSDLLSAFAAAEAAAEAGPYRRYAEVLDTVTVRLAERLAVPLADGEEHLLAASLRRWRPFADTVPALRALRRRYGLGVLSNVDDALFADTRPQLGVPIDWLVTAEQVGSYKPAARNFARLLEVVGLPADRILHVAQSLYHDIAPARAAGLSTVWIDRRAGRSGAGATPASDATADLRCENLLELLEALDLSP